MTDSGFSLESFLERPIKIVVIGSGGAGNNTLDTLRKAGLAGVTLVAANTDAQDLLDTEADGKILLGRELTKGLGAGNHPEVGEAAAKQSLGQIKATIEGNDLVFLVGGLGGGTGTGSLPVMAQVCKDMGILTVAVVSLPFRMEGRRRWENAMQGLQKLERVTDSLVLLPNEKLIQHADNMPLQQAFSMADTITAEALRGFVDLIMRPGLVNLDFANLRAILEDSGVALIGVGESDSQNRPVDAAQAAMSNPLIDVNLRDAQGALINVIGGKDMTLVQTKAVIEHVKTALAEDAKVVLGTQIDDTMDGRIRVLVIITGLSSKSLIDSRAVEGFVDVDELL